MRNNLQNLPTSPYLKPSYPNRAPPIARYLQSHRSSLPNFTFDGYCASVIVNDALAHGETEAHVTNLGGKKWVEHEGKI